MTANQMKRESLVRRARQLFVVADNLKTLSDGLFLKADELREAMRASQNRIHKLQSCSRR